MATRKKPNKAKQIMSAEDRRKQMRKKEKTASAKTVSRQFNKDQRTTVFGKKLPSTFARAKGVRPKRYSESELEWMWNTLKEDVGKDIKLAKKKLYGK